MKESFHKNLDEVEEMFYKGIEERAFNLEEIEKISSVMKQVREMV